MSEDDELRKLREQKMAEMQQQQMNQANQQEMRSQQKAQFEAQKQAVLRKILSSEARSRLSNIRLARPEFAANIEMQLIQAFQQGSFGNQIPISDQVLKKMLMKVQQSQKRESKINFR